jgi:hypothetical protein
MNPTDVKFLDYQVARVVLLVAYLPACLLKRTLNAPGAPIDNMGRVPRPIGNQRKTHQSEFSFLASLDPKDQPKGYLQSHSRKGEHMLGTSIMAV